MTIPKKIFYCWFGGVMPQKVINYIHTWEAEMPDYEIIKIGEENNPYFNLHEECKKNLWLNTCYERKMWAYVADYARLKVLYDYGGIYFDTDITVEKSLEPLIKKNKLVLGWESNLNIANGVMITPKFNKMIEKILDYYNTKIWLYPLYTIPQITTYILRKNYALNAYNKITENDDILILPPEYFYPLPFGTNPIEMNMYITNNSYTVHWWEASWCRPEVFFFLENKHKIPLDKIDSEYKRNKIFQNIFAINNSGDKRHKIITVCGLRIKLKRGIK